MASARSWKTGSAFKAKSLVSTIPKQVEKTIAGTLPTLFDCPTYPTFATLPVAVAPQNAQARPRVRSENGLSLPAAESPGPFPPPAFQPRLLLPARPPALIALPDSFLPGQAS